MSLEDDIIKTVSKYPGTTLHGFSDMVVRTANVLVAQGKLCVRYNGTEKCYYPPEQIAEKDAKVYLAASRHRDGTIHIYLKGKDVGMRIRPSPSEDHMIITTDDDSFGLVKLSDVARLRNKISEQAGKIDELSAEIKQVEKVSGVNSDASRYTMNKQSDRIDQLLDERIRNVETIASKQERTDSLVRDSEVLSSALAASTQRANDLEEIAEDDADAWKKRECDLLEMVTDRDATISSMNAALCRLLRIAERNDILAKDKMFRELYMGRDTGVFRDVDMP